jgi:hypothetical protein
MKLALVVLFGCLVVLAICQTTMAKAIGEEEEESPRAISKRGAGNENEEGENENEEEGGEMEDEPVAPTKSKSKQTETKPKSKAANENNNKRSHKKHNKSKNKNKKPEAEFESDEDDDEIIRLAPGQNLTEYQNLALLAQQIKNAFRGKLRISNTNGTVNLIIAIACQSGQIHVNAQSANVTSSAEGRVNIIKHSESNSQTASTGGASPSSSSAELSLADKSVQRKFVCGDPGLGMPG